MSFPRAKIQRFNDISNGTPSPADYNPKIKNRVTGAVLSTTDRFLEHKSPAHSDTASAHSQSSTTCFRTPILPKKKKAIAACLPKPICTNLFYLPEPESEALNDKIVECNNKDTYIHELVEQIEDMKIQVNKLESQKEELKHEKEKFENLIKRLQNNHETELKILNNKHSNEQKSLEKEISNTNLNLELTKNEFDNLKKQENDYQKLVEHMKANHKLNIENMKLQMNIDQSKLVENIARLSKEIDGTKTAWNNLRLENKKDIEHLLENINKFQDLNMLLMKTYNEEIAVKVEIIENEKQISIQLQRDLDELKKLQLEEIETLKAKHKVEITDIEYEMLKTVTVMQNNLDQEKKALESKYKSDMANIVNSHKEVLMKVQNQAEAQIKHIEEDCREANLLTEMQMLEKYKDIEMMWQIKFDTQIKYSEKTLKESQELNEFNLMQCKVENENLKKEIGEKLQETENKWKLKLETQVKESEEILKECQAISEYNIIQCEVEKHNVKQNLSETQKQLIEANMSQQTYLSEKNDIETIYNKLKLEYDEVIDKLKQTQDDLAKQTKKIEDGIQKGISDKHTFEVTISKTHKTVEALTKRLIDSDRDVEQLKSELEICEKTKLDLEDKCNKLTDDFDHLKKINEDLEFQNESTLKLSEEKIQTLEKELSGKVNGYKTLVQESLTDTKTKLEIKTEELEMTKEQLYQQQILNTEAQNLIGKVTSKLDECNILSDGLQNALKTIVNLKDTVKNLEKNLNEENMRNKEMEEKCIDMNLKNEEIETLSKQVVQLQEKSDSYYQYCEYYKVKANEYELELADMNNINKKYIDQSGKYDELLQKYEILVIKNNELEIKVAQQESLIGPFRDQLEGYEMERIALISQKHDAEMEAKMMGLKYAEILGHQNQKQKIKHLIDLKTKNFELQESKHSMESKIRAQAKTIEKLRKELSLSMKSPRKTLTADKENINSPNRSLNNSYVSSPLRDRN